ncbi:Ribonuclease H-like domain [Trinorchestia longiramus]|nr:Ribonuclease H-like domain [Trinorchestia longiramus]
MKDHLERIHSDKKNKDLDDFKTLKEKLRTQPNLNAVLKSSASADSEEGWKASYSISLNIAKKGKLYTIGEEIILPPIKDTIENVMKKDSKQVLKSIPLSARSVQQRIEEMAFDVEQTVTSELQHSKFAIQLDESAYGSSNILMVYVRFYSPTLNNIVDEFLFVDYLETDSKGKTIFLCLEEYLNKHKIPFGNISAVSTDSAQAMVGRYRGFSVFLKEKVPSVYAVHCVLHRQHLVVKKLRGELHEALKVCIRSINKIKGHPLNCRLFANLCEENHETFKQLLLHNEVRWLSRGDSLQRLVELCDSTEEFLRNIDPSLCDELKRC